MSGHHVAAAQSEYSAFLPRESLWQAIVDSSDDAIISKDLNGIVQSWNRAAERIFGYTADEMVGASILRLLPDDRKGEETDFMVRLRAGQRVDHFHTVRVRKDGVKIDVSLTISPIRDATGEIVGASKIARDVSGEKRREEELAQAYAAIKRADQMKSDFISTLSHELRTPLTAINGWVQILEDQPSREDVEEGVQVIKRNVRAQSRLIEDLLDMSRIESGKVVLDMHRLDLEALLHAALETVRPGANAKSIRLQTTFSRLDGIVMGDRNRIQQVIWNLLSNAIKFTAKGGRVLVTARRVDSHVELSVNDSGIGIAPEFLPQVFERFSQADSSTRRRHGGLGIGLSIVKHLVELHGGTVTATSEGPGKGATFTVCLPLTAVDERSEPAIPTTLDGDSGKPHPKELDGLRILAVDDEPDALGLIHRLLSRHGAVVRTASSVDEALEQFHRSATDIIVSDIGMPGRDGYDFITALRALPDGRGTPAIALTALARAEDRIRAVRAGYQVHLSKPVDAAELISTVKSLAEMRA